MLISLIVNLIKGVFALLGTPFRLFSLHRRPRWVRFRLRGDPPYRKDRKPRFQIGARKKDLGDVPSLHELAQRVAFVCKDPKALGIVFQVEELELSPAKREALIALFGDVRKAGKKVIAHVVTADTPSYELLAHVDRLLMSPAGQLFVIGYSAEATALATGLERVGIRADFVRRGSHKTAPELFTHPKVSDIQRQTIEGFLDERYEALLDALVTGRKLSREEARRTVDEGPFSARRAQQMRLVDDLVHEADLRSALEPKDPVHDPAAKEKDKNAWKLGSYDTFTGRSLWPPKKWRPFKRRPRVAVVPVKGMIVDGAGGGSPLGPRMVTTRALVKSLRAAAKDRHCPAVVLHVDSPGGSAVASEVLLEEVQRLSKKKPVITFFDRVAASGGYMLALGGREIWAAPHAVAGSIGVFAGKFDASGLLSLLGVHRTVITRGENSGLFTTSRPFSPHERAALEASVEETYQAFLEHVATARKKTREEVHALGEGRVYSGRRALEVGLVDRLGGFEEACRHALELAGKPTQGFELKTFQERKPGLGLLSAMRGLEQTRLYALWMPALTWKGPWG